MALRRLAWCMELRLSLIPLRPPRPSASSALKRTQLEVIVARAAAAFGRDPRDDLVRIHDVAGLAVDAVREVDLEAQVLGVGLLRHHLVDRGRAELLAGVAVLDAALRLADVRVRDVEVDGLVL